MSQEQIQVPKGWELKKFSDREYFLDIIGGGTPSRSNPEYFGGEIPWVRLADMKQKYISTTNETLTKKGLDKGSTLIPKNTVILSTRASIGKVGIAQTELCTNQGFKSIVCNHEKIIPEFLYYFLLTIKSQLQQLGSSTTYAEVNRAKLVNVSVPIPQLSTQKKIIQKLDDILGQLEEKKKVVFFIIEQNKEKIDFFEENWFTYIIEREIEKHPQRKEWSISTLAKLPQEGNDKFTDGPFGSNLQVKDYTSSGIPIIRLQNIGVSKFIDKNWKFTSEKKYNELIRHSALPGDVLIAKMAEPVARSTIITPIFEKYMIAADCVKLRINEQKAIPEFVSYAINSYSVRKQALSLARGMTRLRINLREIKKLEIPLPPISTQKEIVQNIKNAEEKFKSQKVQFENIKENYENSITNINHIQSSILDTAFSGKLVT